MSYIISIKTAILLFPLIALLFTIPFILNQYHKYGSVNKFRVCIIYSFILYIITIYFLVILPLPDKNTFLPKDNMVRIVPFGFIRDFMKESSFVLTEPMTYWKAIQEPCFYTVLFNIFMTVPFGMYLRYYFKCTLKKTVLCSFLLSLFFELTQLTGLYYIYPYPYRIFDIDDLITNTLGGTIGFYMVGLISRFLPTRDEIDRKSIENGKIVSGLRRITVFGFDFILNIFFTVLISIVYRGAHIFLISFLLYYIVYPYCTCGTTIGSRFLNVRLEFEKNSFLMLIFRILFLYTYYFGILMFILYLIRFVSIYFVLETLEIIWIYIFAAIALFLFYLVNIVILLKNRTIYYDCLFRVQYKSDIEKKANL